MKLLQTNDPINYSFIVAFGF